jgi:hypothetical protein
MLLDEFNLPRRDLECNVEQFLNAMMRKGLLMEVEDRPSCEDAPRPIASRKDDYNLFPPENLFRPGSGAAEPATARIVCMTVFATVGLIAAQVLLKVRGFCWLHRTVRRWPVRKRKCCDRSAVADVSAVIAKASRYCPRRVWCLERAAVTVCLLRWRGLPAKFVIGCQRTPFASHAWAEVFQTPVNEDALMIPLYRAIERC